jgi:hypothetical protein
MPSVRTALLFTLLLAPLALLSACGSEPPDDFDDEDDGVAPQTVVVEGEILEVARAAGRLIIEDTAGQMWAVSLASRPAMVADDASRPGQIEMLPGLSVVVTGTQTSREHIQPDSIRFRSFPPVVLAQPRKSAALTRPVIPIDGHAAGARSVRYRLAVGDSVLADGILRSSTIGARRYGTFRGNVQLARYDLAGDLTLRVWREGDDADTAVERPVRFAQEHSVSLYFPNREADPQRLRCDAVFPLAHRAPVLSPPEEIVRLLMEEIPRDQRRRGFYSELTLFGEVTSVRLQERHARVELGRPQEGLAFDSCRVVAARAQLERTLGDMYGVDTVTVMVDGVQLVAGRGR